MHEQPADRERDVVVKIWPTAKNVSTGVDADRSGDRRDQHNATDPAKPIQEKSACKRSGWPEQAPDFYVSEFQEQHRHDRTQAMNVRDHSGKTDRHKVR